MLEIAIFLILLTLSGAVAFLLYDRRKIQALLEEKDHGEMVTQAELDSYHHRVVQLYQTQRDWSRGKFEETDHRLNLLERARKEEPQGIVPAPALESKPVEPIEEATIEPRLEYLPTISLAISPGSPPTPTDSGPPTESVCETESFLTAEEKVLQAWGAGRSIDQIAQELRMGRQEVQLLIQVSRRRPAGPVGAQ